MAPLPEEDVPTPIGTPGGRFADAPSDADSDDDTTTAEAGPPAAHLRTRPIASTVPVAAGSDCELTDLDLEELDETEVRTRPGNVPLGFPVALRAPRPAAGVPAAVIEPDTEPEEDDGVTTRAIVPPMPTAPELAALGIDSSVPSTDLQERPSELLTRPSIEPETRPGSAEPETRSGLSEPYAEEGDSVTTQAPAFSEELMAAATAPPKTVHDATLEDLTEGTTKKLRRPREEAKSLPADSESESITTQAPAPLTNMLRVMAADGTPENGIAALAEDEPPENRTAVMANAPLQRVVADPQASPGSSTASLPPIRPTAPGITIPRGSSAARASAAPQLTPASESGLRVARQPEHASVGGLGVADPRPSGTSPQPSPDLRPFVQTEVAFPAQPSVHEVDLGRGPRYGLVVALVAAVSFIVPVTLFVALRDWPEDAVVGGTPSEAATELQQRDGTPRGKLDRKAAASAAAASVSAAAAASASASAHSKPPHRR